MERYGETLKLTLFGRSHGPLVGMTMTGLPSGLAVDAEKLQTFLNRRAPGRAPWSSPRREDDVPEFLSGLKDGKTTGGPLTAVIRNRDANPSDYENLKSVPRPGHADYPASVKYGPDGIESGGGRFSGRMTAPLCVAGGLCRQFLEELGISVSARVLSVGPVSDSSAWTSPVPEEGFPAADPEAGKRMIEWILQKKAEGDSCGGVIECRIDGLPAGIGGPLFGGMESRISEIVFAIPAVKGIEFGDGFRLAERTGSESNDAFCVKDGKILTETNHCGGLLGGMTDGMPVLFRVAVKPVPSVSVPQKSVDL
ncbi:MAG: chorismate synthase, partial [Clostridia bacterium]|nr:chorismate synthase [Clostridia bacterium]